MQLSNFVSIWALVAMGATAAPMPSGSAPGKPNEDGARPSQGLTPVPKVHDGSYHSCETCAYPFRTEEGLAAHRQADHGNQGAAARGSGRHTSKNRGSSKMSERERLDRLASRVGEDYVEKRSQEATEEQEQGHVKPGRSKKEIAQRIKNLPVTPWNQYGAAVKLDKPTRKEQFRQLPGNDRLTPFDEQGDPVQL
ncbi:hypothetical protein MCOR29_004887 [Pyricularia oryzae]|nr:hypothetical protein MCOR29_004887 [Pyricularia oryzae]KAI6380763.1 hypothetical protein MCOR32_003857 [Pyricularia oryzae]KAI6562038.1 hypothetical protein MCOR03_003563 [Pyricularia oryzae]KAI6588036.1 hypothetical protein MCOR06_006095 [Pyricularia oryzae]